MLCFLHFIKIVIPFLCWQKQTYFLVSEMFLVSFNHDSWYKLLLPNMIDDTTAAYYFTMSASG